MLARPNPNLKPQIRLIPNVNKAGSAFNPTDSQIPDSLSYRLHYSPPPTLWLVTPFAVQETTVFLVSNSRVPILPLASIVSTLQECLFATREKFSLMRPIAVLTCRSQPQECRKQAHKHVLSLSQGNHGTPMWPASCLERRKNQLGRDESRLARKSSTLTEVSR